jgi:hypothetical protein
VYKLISMGLRGIYRTKNAIKWLLLFNAIAVDSALSMMLERSPRLHEANVTKAIELALLFSKTASAALKIAPSLSK